MTFSDCKYFICLHRFSPKIVYIIRFVDVDLEGLSEFGWDLWW